MTSRNAVRWQVADYTILRLKLAPSAAFPQHATHHLYLRAHAPKVPSIDSARSAFLVNIPIDTTAAHLRALFANQLGGAHIERVDFEGAQPATGVKKAAAPKGRSRKRKRSDVDADADADEQARTMLPVTWDREIHASGSAAVVVFVDQPSLKLALSCARKVARKGAMVVWSEGVDAAVPALGSARYLAHRTLQYPDPSALQATVDDYMTAFAAAESARRRALAHERSVPDADGFVTVTRGGRAGPARVVEAQAALERKTAQEDKERAGRQDFYRWQHRERNKARAGELVKAFEEDRRRVVAMREGRADRFKPM